MWNIPQTVIKVRLCLRGSGGYYFRRIQYAKQVRPTNSQSRIKMPSVMRCMGTYNYVKSVFVIVKVPAAVRRDVRQRHTAADQDTPQSLDEALNGPHDTLRRHRDDAAFEHSRSWCSIACQLTLWWPDTTKCNAWCMFAWRSVLLSNVSTMPRAFAFWFIKQLWHAATWR